MMAPLSLGGRSRIALGQVVTSNHFTMLGVPPFLGRLLVPADDEPSAARVVVISHRMWQREFGADPAIAASRLVVGAVPAAVVAFALQGVLYGVQPLDPLAWGLAFTAMAMAAGPANFVPARRAMRIDPMTALRTD